MNTYTLPAATVAALPSEVGTVVYVAVKGECVHPPHAHPPDHFDPAGCNRPPSVLTDLIGKACETCAGTGYHPHHRMEWHDIDCSDCAGTGRALLTIQRLCDGEHDCGLHRSQCSGYFTDPRRWTVDGLWPVVGDDEITVTGPPPSPGDYIVALTLAVTA